MYLLSSPSRITSAEAAASAAPALISSPLMTSLSSFSGFVLIVKMVGDVDLFFPSSDDPQAAADWEDDEDEDIAIDEFDIV